MSERPQSYKNEPLGSCSLLFLSLAINSKFLSEAVSLWKAVSGLFIFRGPHGAQGPPLSE